jgi:outer membrane protein OmpA-like peptidoglycan-associated protein
MAPNGVEDELPLGKGRVDLAVVNPELEQIEIGEIKPANEGGMDAGIEQIEERLRVLPKLKKYRGYKAVPLKYPVKQPIRFETQAPFCLDQPGYCFSQELTVVPPVKGLYLYFCEPSYSELLAGGCHCECKEEKEKEKKKEPDSPGDTLPEKLLKMGEELAGGLAADALLGVALELSGALAAFVLSPLAAVAALVLGIVYFWDKLKWLGHRIAALANWVWGKITWILDTIKTLAIDLGELAVWLGGKIVWLAEKLVTGVKWAAGKAVSGAKWVGHEIASGAEAVWDWLFGSDPEPVAPILDLPEIEPTKRCETVAHDDTIIKIAGDLLFATDESKLLPAADAPLTEAAAKIRSMLNNRDDRVMIDGYTDNVGGVEYNQGLSERRAQAVADWFDQHRAIPKSIIHTEGFGKTEAQNNDPAGRAKDRRVEIWVTRHGSVENVCW